jgi:Family of unknown function (DUF6152)
MKSSSAAVLVGGVLAICGPAQAHHSFAMFDQEHPIELTGTVREFRFVSPHTFILLDVQEADGTIQLWNLEGSPPSFLARDGWSSKTLKPGDEVSMTIEPLRSGVPGGAWNINRVKYKNGAAIDVSR